MAVFGKLRRWIYGYDLFISYSRKDSMGYAYAVALYFTDKKFECYIDQLSSTQPGEGISADIISAIKNSSGFILIGSSGAQESQENDPIVQEIAVFLNNNGSRFFIPVNISSAIDLNNVTGDRPGATAIEKKIFGLPLVDESLKNLNKKTPAKEVLQRIENASTFTKKNKRLRNIASVTLLTVVLVIATAFILTINSAREIVALDRQTKSAILARNTALNQKDSAQRQQKTAFSEMTVAQKKEASVIRSLDVAEQARGEFERSDFQKAAAIVIGAVKESPTTQSVGLLKQIFRRILELYSDTPVKESIMVVDSTGQHLALSTYWGGAYMIGLKTKKTIPLTGHLFPLTHLAFSPGGKYLVSSSIEDGYVQVWDTGTGALLNAKLFITTIGRTPVFTFNPDGSGFIMQTGNGNHIFRKFENLNDDIILNNTEGCSVLFDPSGKYFVTWDIFTDTRINDARLSLFNSSNGKRIWKTGEGPFGLLIFNHHSKRLIGLTSFSPDIPGPEVFWVFDLDKNGIPQRSFKYNKDDFDYHLLFDGSKNDVNHQGLLSALGKRIAHRQPGVLDRLGLGSFFITSDGAIGIGMGTEKHRADNDDHPPFFFDPSNQEVIHIYDPVGMSRFHKAIFTRDHRYVYFDTETEVCKWSVDQRTKVWEIKTNCKNFYLSGDETKLFVCEYDESDKADQKDFRYDVITGTLTRDQDTARQPLYRQYTGKLVAARRGETLYIFDPKQNRLRLSVNYFKKDSARYMSDMKLLSGTGSEAELLEIAERRLINRPKE